MNINGQNFSNFQNVRVKGDNNASGGAIRLVGSASGGYESTIAISGLQEANSAVKLDARATVNVGATGTFAVQLPAIAAFSYGETMVTITGIRKEDAFNCSVQNVMETAVTLTTKAYPFLAGARAENGFVNLTFVNPSTTSTSYGVMVLGYTAFR